MGVAWKGCMALEPARNPQTRDDRDNRDDRDISEDKKGAEIGI